MTAEINLAAYIYPVECVHRTAEAFSHLCTIRLHDHTTQSLTLSVDSSDTDASSFDRLVAEALNYLLDASVEFQMSRA